MICLMQSAGKDRDYWWIWTVQSRNPEEWTGGAGGYTIWEGTARKNLETPEFLSDRSSDF